MSESLRDYPKVSTVLHTSISWRFKRFENTYKHSKKTRNNLRFKIYQGWGAPFDSSSVALKALLSEWKSEFKLLDWCYFY